MRERAGAEIKVGLLSLIGLIILAVLVFSIGDYNLFQERKPIIFVFGFAGGVENSAPVRLAGVKVGEVRSVQLVSDESDGQTRVAVEVWLDRDVALYEDAEVYVNTLGLLGEKYIEILDPGSPSSRALTGGERLYGHDPVPIERITESTHRIISELEKLIGGLNDVVDDAQVRTALKDTVYNFEVTSANLKDASAQVRSGQGTLGHLLYDDALYTELEGFAREIRTRPWRLLKKDRKHDTDSRAKSSGGKDDSNKGFIK